mmetsp:Transcript_7446/g.15593  ORF Transcript_7446/g.15593 Transcript_7446/m.15593 type:complete len:261 (+) Transcript_7446:1649-2431(+)
MPSIILRRGFTWTHGASSTKSPCLSRAPSAPRVTHRWSCLTSLRTTAPRATLRRSRSRSAPSRTSLTRSSTRCSGRVICSRACSSRPWRTPTPTSPRRTSLKHFGSSRAPSWTPSRMSRPHWWMIAPSRSTTASRGLALTLRSTITIKSVSCFTTSRRTRSPPRASRSGRAPSARRSRSCSTRPTLCTSRTSRRAPTCARVTTGSRARGTTPTSSRFCRTWSCQASLRRTGSRSRRRRRRRRRRMRRRRVVAAAARRMRS